MKTCFKCGETKPIDDFYVHPRMKDGHLNKCKECTKIDVKLRDPQKVKEYDLKRSKDERRKAKFIIAQKKRRANHPEKSRAHNAVRRAIKSGDLIRPDHCSICFCETKSVAHHNDYSKPLDVIWVCEPCHKRIHVSGGVFALPF